MDKHQWHSPDSQAATDYVEGRLKNRRLFEEHLDECSRCRLDVEALQRMRGHTRTWAEEEPYQRPRTYKPLFSGIALSLPILLVLGGLYLTPARTQPQKPATKRANPHWETGSSGRTITIKGQSVQLGPYSKLERLDQTRLRLSNGQVRIQEKTSQLDLETDQIEVKPTGTDFEVIHSKGLSRVHLYSGSVKVRQRSDGLTFLLNDKQREWPYITIRPKLPVRAYPTAAP